MAGFSWNREQNIAIQSKAKAILVAAAAGSGKTAVMVQRIIELIKAGTPIDKMLIVTFTNASTADMKGKIRKAVKKEISDSDDRRKRELFRKQLDSLGRANISNFHGFAMNVIKQFFHKLPDLEPGFRVEDDLRLKLIKSQVMDDLFYEYFNRDDEEYQKFTEFLDSYTDGRKFVKVKEQILELHESFRNIPNYMIEIPEMIDKMKGIRTGDDFLNYNDNRNRYIERVKNLAEVIYKDYHCAKNDAKDKGYDELLGKVIIPLREAPAEKLKDKINSEDFESALNSARDLSNLKYSLPSAKELNVTSDERKMLQQQKKSFDEGSLNAKSLKGRHKLLEEVVKILKILTRNGDDLDGEVAYYRKTLNNAEFILNFTLEFDRRYSKAKREAGVIDFSDIEHFAIEILNDRGACDFYRKKFDYIFVDEYQDTSALQEYVIQKIAADSSLFMVGDIKQSIYSFRKADPSIFLSKYEGFTHERNMNTQNGYDSGTGIGGRGDGDGIEESDEEIVVDLSANYRSKIEILDEVNKIFFDTMTGYDENSSLKHGAPNPTDLHHEPVYYLVNDDKENFKGRDRAELEAVAIAKIITESLGKKYYDSKDETIKGIGYGDIVILSKAVKNHGTKMARKLEEFGIPVYVTKKGDFFDAIEVRIFFNLLQVINNRLLDLPLLSVLHSELFEFSEAELAEIALSKEQYFYLKMMDYLDRGRNQELRDKISAFDTLIKDFSEFSMENDLDVLLWKVMQDTGYFLSVGAMPMGELRQGNLQYLVELAFEYENNGNTGLSGFLETLNKIKTDETLMMEETDAAGEGRNAVRIMTIHQSKGLEFPMVILARYNNALRAGNMERAWAFNKDLGLALPGKEGIFSQGKKTILQEMIEAIKYKENMEEYLRLLYVALTRATDILNVVGVCPASSVESFATLAEWHGRKEEIGIEELDDFAAMTELPESIENQHVDIDVDENVKRAVYERLSYRYPFEDAGLVSPKYSATEVNKMPFYGEEYAVGQAPGLTAVNGQDYESNIQPQAMTRPRFLADQVTPGAAGRGSLYHKILEMSSYSDGVAEGYAYLKQLSKDMVAKDIMTEEELKTVNINLIADFFNTDLARRMAKAAERGLLFKEQKFIYSTDADDEIFHGLDERIKLGANKDDLMLQGIIDAFFIEEDEKGEKYFVLVDFKTNRIDVNIIDREIERIKKTYEKQMLIYEKALENSYLISTEEHIPVKERIIYLIGTKICINL